MAVNNGNELRQDGCLSCHPSAVSVLLHPTPIGLAQRQFKTHPVTRAIGFLILLAGQGLCRIKARACFPRVPGRTGCCGTEAFFGIAGVTIASFLLNTSSSGTDSKRSWMSSLSWTS